MHPIKSIAMTMALALVALSSAQLTNAGFEDPALGAGEMTSNGVNGWSGMASVQQGVWNITNGPFNQPAPDGNQVGYLGGGSIAQVSTETMQLGENFCYFYAGRRDDGVSGTVNFAMYVGGTASSGQIVGGEFLLSTTVTPSFLDPGTFGEFYLSYTCGSGDPRLGLPIAVQITMEGGSQVVFDDVEVGLLVPEPASLSAVGIGFLALASRTRRKRGG